MTTKVLVMRCWFLTSEKTKQKVLPGEQKYDQQQKF